jgi:hypothetical protein
MQYKNNVLVLDVCSRPINIVSTKKALKICSLKKSIILREADDKYISTEKLYFNSPLVIQINRYDFLSKLKFTNTLPFSRENVYLRDNGHCMYCNRKVSLSNFTLDHIVPKSLGGKYEWLNIVATCRKCNEIKQNKTLKQTGMKLITEPKVPKLNIKVTNTLANKLTLDLLKTDIWGNFWDIKIN